MPSRQPLKPLGAALLVVGGMVWAPWAVSQELRFPAGAEAGFRGPGRGPTDAPGLPAAQDRMPEKPSKELPYQPVQGGTVSLQGEQPVGTQQPPAGRDAPLPLARRSRAGRAESSTPLHRFSGLSPLVTVGSSLAMVLGLFLVVAWLMGRTGRNRLALLPKDCLLYTSPSPRDS